MYSSRMMDDCRNEPVGEASGDEDGCVLVSEDKEAEDDVVRGEGEDGEKDSSVCGLVGGGRRVAGGRGRTDAMTTVEGIAQ